MSEFSTKERMVAAMLSSMPGVKRWAKKVYVLLNSIIYKKNYKLKVLDNRVELNTVSSEFGSDEVFFGYYDKCCCWENQVIFHRTGYPSTHKPTADETADVYLKKIGENNSEKIGSTRAYNWQQGARLHWISESEILYNIFDEKSGEYKTVLYSTDQKCIKKIFDKPVQESYKNEFFLSINYQRLRSMRPDYCYRCKPEMTKAELADHGKDGIWRVDMKSGECQLLHSIDQVLKLDYRNQFERCNHNVNHVMLSPNGKRFIFIHRNYLGKQRYDRLILSDFKKLKVVIDEQYVSHCCWIDDSTILGYLKYNGERAFFFINVDSLKISKCEEMSALHTGDGHPSYNGRFVVFDTYPDKSRMQKLFLYDLQSKIVYPLLELYQSVKYEEETRCDLHPRFSEDGHKVFFDSVFNGHRELCFVDISDFYN